MRTAATVLRALDLLNILASLPEGLTVPEVVHALNQPRTNVIRLLFTLELYGFAVRDGRRWRTTPAFVGWASSSGRHRALRRQYRGALERIAARTGELTALGVHEGNGVVHIDYIETNREISTIAPADTRFALRTGAMGKIALSRRPDLAAKIRSASFQKELAEVRRTGVAWNRGESVPGMIALACAGFTNSPTDAFISVSWPIRRFSERKGSEAVRVIKEALTEVAGREPDWVRALSIDPGARPSH